MNALEPAPALAPPGAGIPLIERLVFLFVMLPLMRWQQTPQQHIDTFVTLGRHVLEQVRALPPTQQQTPVLIARPSGLEDSSRCWSPLMVVEHLLVTGQGIQGICQTLARNEGITALPEVRTQDVKPVQAQAPEVLLAEFESFLESYQANMPAWLAPLRQATGRHPHPWFRPLTGLEWLAFNAMHCRLHAGQLKAILQK